MAKDTARSAALSTVIYCLLVASLVFGLSFCGIGCQSWQARRSYSIFIEDQQGRRAGAGVIIDPLRSGK